MVLIKVLLLKAYCFKIDVLLPNNQNIIIPYFKIYSSLLNII